MEPIYGLPGDVFFTHSSSLLGTLIRWAEKDPNEPNGVWANHVGVVVSPGWIVPPFAAFRFTTATVIESLWKTERWSWWNNHLGEKGNEIRVYRRPDLTAEQVRLIERKANEFVGRTYGWWKLFAHLGDRMLFAGRKTISNLLTVEKRPICSYTVAHAFQAADIYFGMEPNAADPDEMMDYCEQANEWKLVGSSKIEGVK
jgi:hypothetical protein